MPRKTAKALDMTHDEVIARMLSRTLTGKDGHAYIISLWGSSGNEPSDMEGEHLKLREDDAQPLIDAGLLYKTESGTIYYGLTAEGIRRAIPLVGFKSLDIEKLIHWALDTVLFTPAKEIDGQTAIPAIYVPGKGRIVLVLGENAAGKSVFRRIVNGLTHRGRPARDGDPEIRRGPFPVEEFIGLSMQGRTGGQYMSSMVYGEESYHSTGENSAHTVTMGIKTARDRDHTSILYWDEPDIGMSNGAAAGVGVAIRDFLASGDTPLVEAVFVTTHSPAMVQQLLPLDPHYLYLGDDGGPKTLADWVAGQINPAPVSPETLVDLSHKRYRLIQAVLNATGGRKKKA